MIKRKKALGKGLGALITDATSVPRGDFLNAPIDEIQTSRRQPRKRFDQAGLTELADSIKENGIIEPLVVRRVSSGLELIAGERRWRAARAAGLKFVPVVIKDATDAHCFELALIENIQREDLDAMEVADAYKTLVDQGLTQEEVARKVGKDRATVTNYLRLLKLPPEVTAEIISGKISMGHARAILSIEGPAAQRKLCREVVSKGLSVRETERLAARGERKVPPTEKTAIHLKPIEKELRELFGTKVTITERSGRGRVNIEFYSSEERERILDILRSMG